MPKKDIKKHPWIVIYINLTRNKIINASIKSGSAKVSYYSSINSYGLCSIYQKEISNVLLQSSVVFKNLTWYLGVLKRYILLYRDQNFKQSSFFISSEKTQQKLPAPRHGFSFGILCLYLSVMPML